MTTVSSGTRERPGGFVEEPLIDEARRGLLFIISSASGTGKTTVTRSIIEHESNISLSVSVTTRPQRPKEIEGKDYFFIDRNTFREGDESGRFLETAEVFGHYYGTPKGDVLESIEAGRDILFEVEWHGARQLTEKLHDDAVSLFILPPSMAELERRLTARGQDSPEVIAERMRNAPAEIAHCSDYDFVIVNHTLKQTVADATAILNAERLRRQRRSGLPALIEKMSGSSP